MDEIIKKHRAMVAERLSQGFSAVPRNAISKAQEGFDDIEKARVVRQDGDIHPNGKWVWSSQAAGGKGDWRVIKKQKDGAAAPASSKTEKKEIKSDNGASSKSSEALTKTLDNMSIEELTELESIIASAVDKKKEAPTPAAPEVSEPAKTKKEDADSSKVVDAPKMTDKEFRDELKRAIEEGNLNSQPSKNKVESIYKSIRKRFGDKASVKLTEYGQPVAYVTFGDLELKVSYREDKKFGDEVTTQWTLSGYDSDTSHVTKARKFKAQDDLHSPDIYLSLLKMRAKDKLKSLEAQGSSSRADIDHIKSELKRIESAEEEVSMDGTHVRANKQDADKAFNDDVKRVVDASALKDPASKSAAVEMLTAAKERFGDKVRVELHNPSRNPTAIVDFGNGLELGFSYRNDGYTYTFWKLSGFEEEFAMKLKERGFDVRNYNDSPITCLDAEINNARAMLRRINNEDDEFAWTVNLNRLKAIKNKLEREFKTFKL